MSAVLDVELNTPVRRPGTQRFIGTVTRQRAGRVDQLLHDERWLVLVADVLALTVVARTTPLPLGIVVLIGVMLHLSRPKATGLRPAVLSDLPRAWVAIALGSLFAGYLLPHHQRGVLVAGVVTAALVSVHRAIAGGTLSLLRRRGVGVRPTLVVGSGELTNVLMRKIARYPELGMRVVGSVAPCGRRGLGWGLGVGALADDLPGLIERSGVREILVVTEDEDPGAVARCLEACDDTGARVSIVPSQSQFLMDPRRVEHIAGIPVIGLGRLSRAPRRAPAKRAFDILVAAAALVALAPLMLAIALWIRLDSSGPVLFRQRRVGLRGRAFDMMKFRSMVVGAETQVIALANESDGLLFKMRDDPRITRIGRIIRKLSIDELPQLFNVLRGEMSIVGPRPLPVDAANFGPIDSKRLNVRPGITGLWQILGRSDLGYDEMVKLDLAYIQRWSLWSDAQILLRTIPVVLRREGAY